jgi:hypothetical protein
MRIVSHHRRDMAQLLLTSIIPTVIWVGRSSLMMISRIFPMPAFQS